MADKYLLRVTAGPSYDTSTHVVLPVNTSKSTPINSPYCSARVKVRVQNYRGLPRNSPHTSPYFSDPSHIHDQYSIEFTFVPKSSVSGAALLFGNDFERPIRDRLPPGFSTAFRIVKWAVDPGLEGDPYADQPYLYSPLLATLARLRIGAKATKRKSEAVERQQNDEWEFEIEELGDEVLEEGFVGDGAQVRREKDVPDAAAERKKWGLRQEIKEDWTWEEGRAYSGDFFNPYLDFNTFSLKLPGFSLPVLGHLGGEDSLRRSHELRYTLKDMSTGNVFFVVVFTLLLREDVEKEEAEEAAKETKTVETSDTTSAEQQSKNFQPSEDDLD